MSFMGKIRLGPIKIQLQCFPKNSKTQCENDFSSIKSLLSIKNIYSEHKILLIGFPRQINHPKERNYSDKHSSENQRNKVKVKNHRGRPD